MAKKRLRPIIRITSDHLSLASLICDIAILILLFFWFIYEILRGL